MTAILYCYRSTRLLSGAGLQKCFQPLASTDIASMPVLLESAIKPDIEPQYARHEMSLPLLFYREPMRKTMPKHFIARAMREEIIWELLRVRHEARTPRF